MIDFLDKARQVLALLIVAGVPAVILYWCLIHPFATFWRRLGPVATLVVVGGITISGFTWTAFHVEPLLAMRYPFSWPLALVGFGLYAFALRIEQQCRRQLKFRILAGVPEISKDPGHLITDGIFARTRNPRYLNILIGLAGWALILNYPAVYLAVFGFFPAIYLVILLEERELKQRFGSQYQQYLAAVPRLVPQLRWRRPKR